MKRISAILLGILLLVMLTGCGSSKTEKAAREQSKAFMSALVLGDWETLRETWGLEYEEDMQKGIIHEMLKSITYEIKSVEEQEDGSVLVSMQIENVDFRSLMELLPDTVDSKEEAQQEMVSLVKTAARKQYEGSIILTPMEGQDSYTIEMDERFTNAITGGMYDVFVELMEVAIGG